MNIDDLKDAWNNDEPQGMHIPDNTRLLGKTTSVIDKVRSNMRKEFFATLIIYPVMLLALIYIRPDSLVFNIGFIFLFTIIVLNAYFYIRFYAFYKSIARYDLNIRESIRKITYELELNTEIYKAYNFCVTPLTMLLTITLFCGRQVSGYVQHALASDVLISFKGTVAILATILISFVTTYSITAYYIRCLYGKYITELKQVTDDLGSET